MTRVSEKRVMTELLQLYKDLPCLWDTHHSLYSNKESRARAYNVLLEKYKLIQPDAGCNVLKKKLENMRTCYRRERKKVLRTLLKYGEEREPSLWYYDHLKFLDDSMGGYGNLEGDDDDDEESDTKRKDANISSIFLTEEDYNDAENSYNIDNSVSQPTHATNMTSSEAFGRTVGIQLQELQPMQRYIAEKLISEVIFYGRMQKLSAETKLDVSQ